MEHELKYNEKLGMFEVSYTGVGGVASFRLFHTESQARMFVTPFFHQQVK